MTEAPGINQLASSTRRLIARAASGPSDRAQHPYGDRAVRTALNVRFRERGVPVKVCSRCLVVQALSAFTRFSTASDGLQSYCRTCKAADHARKQASDPAYRAMNNERTKAHYAENAQQRRAYSARRQKALRAANRAKHADRVQDPNVLKRCTGRCGQLLPETSFRLDRGQPDGLRARCRDCATGVARQLCWDTHGAPDGHVCYLCMALIESAAEAQADHLLPQSAGGPDEPSNLRWTHGECNSRRCARPLTPEEWRRIELLDALQEGATS